MSPYEQLPAYEEAAEAQDCSTLNGVPTRRHYFFVGALHQEATPNSAIIGLEDHTNISSANLTAFVMMPDKNSQLFE